MSSLKKTQTLTTKVKPPFGEEFQIAATLPLERPVKDGTNKIPISIFLSKVGTETALGCYVYTIADKKGNSFQTLLNNSEETLVDITKKIGTLITKKFNVPSYVCVSGNWTLEDLIVTVQNTVKFIEDSF